MSLKDFALNPETGDMALLDSSFHFVEGAQAVVQQLAITFAIFLGEWFLDLTKGVPYKEEILVKNPDLDQISKLMRKTILDLDAIVEIRTLELVYDLTTRHLRVGRFEALTTEGIVVVDDAPLPLQPWNFVILFNL